jgi:hypothetical protein
LDRELQGEFEENCIIVICLPSDSCEIGNEQKKETYVKSILINSYKNVYKPKIIKFICYE